MRHLLPMLLLMAAFAGAQDIVETRNGSRYQGNITAKDSAAISIEVPGGSVIRISRSEILRIRYGTEDEIQAPYFERTNTPKPHRVFHQAGIGPFITLLSIGYIQQITGRFYVGGSFGSVFPGLVESNILSLGGEFVWRSDKRLRPFLYASASHVTGDSGNLIFDYKIYPSNIGNIGTGMHFRLIGRFGITYTLGWSQTLWTDAPPLSIDNSSDAKWPLLIVIPIPAKWMGFRTGISERFGIFWEF